MSNLSHSPFHEALSAERERLNAQFALRRQGSTKLDEADFLEHLRHTVGPLVDAVHDHAPERCRAVLVSLFDASLDLFAASLLGTEPRHPFVARLWRDVLPLNVRLLARDPHRLAGCLSNAMQHLAVQSGTRPDVWLERMARLLPACESVTQLLQAGQVAAWQAGMVQYRTAALDALDRLPPTLGAETLGLSAGSPPEPWPALVQRLRRDCWQAIDTSFPSGPPTNTLHCVARAGAFRGFGGLFLRPPTVVGHDGRLLVSDGHTHWQLYADAFGLYLHRIEGLPGLPVNRRPIPEISASEDGTVRWGEHSGRFPELTQPTSLACDGTTLAVTTGTSFHVYLLTRQGTPA